jgi:ornithine carrier protein
MAYPRTPIELIKVKMQVTLLATEGLLPSASASPSPSSSLPSSSASSAPHSAPPPAKPDFKRLPGPFTILRQIIVTKGLRGLWLGQTGTLLRETGGSSAWFTGFEVVSRMFMRRREVSQGLEKGSVKKADLTAWELCCAGGFAGRAYNGTSRHSYPCIYQLKSRERLLIDEIFSSAFNSRFFPYLQ